MGQKELWQAVLGELEVSVSRASFATWFRHTSILSQEDGHMVIAVPNIFTKGFIEKNYHAHIKSAVSRMNPGISSVEYKVTTGSSAKPKTTDAITGPAATPLPTATSPQTTSSPSNAAAQAGGLNPRYTLDNFVVGSSNDLAFAACQAVAKYPGEKYSILFIYGGVGLGKTHLMQAIGNEVLKNDPTKRVQYVTSEAFTSEFISSVSGKKTKGFADKYRNLDVLIIDDIQFLGNKERTQEEFFHTFNTLHQQNKQIVLSSDKPPKTIPHLEDRLKSRFEMGMLADIQMPDLETRSAILQRKAGALGLILQVEVIDYLARHCQNNIRELEGMLTQFMAICEMRGLEPSVASAQSLLGNLAGNKAKRKVATPKAIIEKTATYFDLQPVDITGSKRDKEIVVPRQIAMYLMRQELSLSFPKIASCVGGRDHTTAMHSVGKIEKLIEVDEGLRQDINAIKERISI